MVLRPRGNVLLASAALIMCCSAVRADEKAPAAAATEAVAPPARQLDLRPPDITRLYSREQIERILGDSIEQERTLEEVEVERERERTPPRTPTVWGGPFTVFWGLLHPTQAWRILAPLPPDQTGGPGYDRPDATEGYLEPAAQVP